MLVLYNSSEEYSFRYFFYLLVRGHWGPLMFSGVFITEEVDGVGDKWS